MAIRYGRGDVKQTTTGFRDPRHHICQKQIPIPRPDLLEVLYRQVTPGLETATQAIRDRHSGGAHGKESD